MLSVKFVDVFLSQFYESNPIPSFAKITKRNDSDPIILKDLPDVFEGIYNSSFVLTLANEDLRAFDWQAILHKPICRYGLLMDLPPITFPIQKQTERRGLTSQNQTLYVLGEMGENLQRKMARKLVHYAAAVGLARLSFENFRVLEKGCQWGLVCFDPKIFQNPDAKHSIETTTRILAVSLMRGLSATAPNGKNSYLKLEPVDPKISPFFDELKALYKQSIRYSFTKIFLSIISVGILPVYYAIRSAVICYKIQNLTKKLEKETLVKDLFLKQRRKICKISKQIQKLVGDTAVISSESQLIRC